MDKARMGAMALLLAALPAKAEAQSDWWGWTLQEPNTRVEVGDRSDGVRGVAQVYRDDRRDGRYDRRYEGRYEGRVRVRVAPYGVRWERRHGIDVVFGRAWHRARAQSVDERALRAMMGRGAWARLELTRRHLGARYALTGRWLRPRAGVLVLQVRSGPVAIAELTDLNGDGRVDVFLVAGR
jgi:hypothetical protein